MTAASQSDAEPVKLDDSGGAAPLLTQVGEVSTTIWDITEHTGRAVIHAMVDSVGTVSLNYAVDQFTKPGDAEFKFDSILEYIGFFTANRLLFGFVDVAAKTEFKYEVGEVPAVAILETATTLGFQALFAYMEQQKK